MSRIEELRMKRDAKAAAAKSAAASPVPIKPAPAPSPSPPTAPAPAAPAPPAPEIQELRQTKLVLKSTQSELAKSNSSLAETNASLKQANEEVQVRTRERRATCYEQRAKRELLTEITRALALASLVADCAHRLPLLFTHAYGLLCSHMCMAQALKFVLEKQKEKMQALKTSAADASSPVVDMSEVDELSASLEAEQGKCKSVSASLEAEQSKYKSVLADMQQLQKVSSATQSKLQAAAAENKEHEEQIVLLMDALETLKEQKVSSAQNENATLSQQKADVANLRRKNEELEGKLDSTNKLFEVLTLSHEELKLENETLDEKVEELTLDCETAQMEIEELNEQIEGGGGVGELDGGDDDVAVQNVKLTKALGLLRSQSAETQKKLTSELRAAEKRGLNNEELQKESAELKVFKKNSGEQIEQLKDEVETSASFEEMVGQLTDKNLALEDANQMLLNVNSELEQAAELSAEMEEVQSEELKAVQGELAECEVRTENLNEAIRVQREQHRGQAGVIDKYKELAATLRSEVSELRKEVEGVGGEIAERVEKSQRMMSERAKGEKKLEEMRAREKQRVLEEIALPVEKWQGEVMRGWLVSELAGDEMAALAGDVLLQRVGGVCKIGLRLLEGGAGGAEGEEGWVGECALAELFVRGHFSAVRELCGIGLDGDSMNRSSGAGNGFSEVNARASRSFC